MTKQRLIKQEYLSKPGYKNSQWHRVRDAFIVHPVKQLNGRLLDGEAAALLGQVPVNPEMCPVYLAVETNWATGFFGFSSTGNVFTKKSHLGLTETSHQIK